MITTEFCENSKVAFSDIAMMKNNVALSPLIFPMKLICCLKSRVPNSIYLLRSVAISL